MRQKLTDEDKHRVLPITHKELEYLTETSDLTNMTLAMLMIFF